MNKICYIENNLDKLQKHFPDHPLLVREVVRSIDYLFDNDIISEFSIKNQLISIFTDYSEEEKKAVLEKYNSHFDVIFFKENKGFFKTINQQVLPLNESEEDILFIIMNLDKKCLIELKYSHYLNYKLYSILKKEENIYFYSQDLNWIVNFTTDFDIIVKEELTKFSLNPSIINQNDIPNITYIEGKTDLIYYSLLFPERQFQIEEGSHNILTIMKEINFFHKNNAIIDKDALNNEAITELKKMAIFAIEFSEIENIWLNEDLLNLFFKKSEVQEIKEKILKIFEDNLNNFLNRFKYRQDFYKKQSIPFYTEKELIYKEKEFKKDIQDRNYNKIIKIMEGKGILNKIFKDKKSLIKTLKKDKELQHKIKLLLKLGDLLQ